MITKAERLLEAYEQAIKLANKDKVAACIVDLTDGTYEIGTAATMGYHYPGSKLHKRWVYPGADLSSIVA